MTYLLSKVFPFLWPYIKEIVTGWIEHPYFTRNGYKAAMKKFGILLIFIAFMVIGNEYVATLRELELIKQEVKSKPPAYVSFEDVRNYHDLFNSPETRQALDECRDQNAKLNADIIERNHELQLEKKLHEETKKQLERKGVPSTTSPPLKERSSRDILNDRLNSDKDS